MATTSPSFKFEVTAIPSTKPNSWSIRVNYHERIYPEILLSDYVVSNDDINLLLVLPDDCTLVEQREVDISRCLDFDEYSDEVPDPFLTALDQLDLPGDLHHELRRKIETTIWGCVWNDWPDGTIIANVDKVQRVRFRPNQNSSVDRQVEEWIEANNWSDHKPTPASKSAIHSLAKVRFGSGCVVTCECCAICMEEFEEGSEISLMPCKHVYHGECIRKWLEISHMCPLCRFPMPR